MRRPRFLLHAARILDDVLFWPALGLVVWGEIGWHGGGFLHNLNDKLLHFLAYFTLGAMAAGGIKARRNVILAVLGVIALGGLLEIVQSYVGRDSELYDALANTAGAVFGAALARFIVEPLRKKFPS